MNNVVYDNVMKLLANLNSIIDSGMIMDMGDSIGVIANAGKLLLFGIILISFVKSMVNDGIDTAIKDVYPLVLKGFFIGLIFCNATLYTYFYTLFLNVFSSISDYVLSDGLYVFKTQIRLFFESVAKVNNGGQYSDVQLFNSDPVTLILSLLIDLSIIVTYLNLSAGNVFIIIVFFVGPIIIPFSLLFRDMFQRWLYAFFGSLLFVLFIGLAMIALQNSNLINMASVSIYAGSKIASIISISMMVVFMVVAPVMIAYVFGVSFFNINIGILNIIVLMFTGGMRSIVKSLKKN